MLRKVCFFPQIYSQYGVLDQFTLGLSEAFQRLGVESVIINVDKNNPAAFLQQLLTDPPDCTLCFNGLLPDHQGRFLCDMIRIPHVAYLTDAPTYYFSLVKSPLNVIACIDQNFSKAFTDLNFPNVLFLPHAADREIKAPLHSLRKYDVLVLNSYINYEALRKQWTERYSAEICKVLDEATTLATIDPNLSSMQAFIATLDKYVRSGKKIEISQTDYELILDELEAYFVGKKRTELLKSIEGVEVDIFGADPEGWKKALGEKKNIHVHAPVPFEEAVQLMKEAKIVLNCSPQMKKGLHERIVTGLACGAAVMTMDTSYLREQFKHGEEIILYPLNDHKIVNEMIQTYLKDETKRVMIAKNGREKVLSHHTWDQRASFLMKELPAILERLK